MLDLNDDAAIEEYFTQHAQEMCKKLPPARFLEWYAGPSGGCGTGWDEAFYKYMREA